MKHTSIQEIMTRQLQTITTNDDVIDAKRIMVENKISHLPVLLDGQLVGIISKNDIAQVEFLCDFIGEKLDNSTVFKSLSIHELMAKKVESLSSNSTIEDAALIFSNSSFQCLPIIENGKIIGLVTTKDVFRFLSDKKLEA
ncbi:MAG: CBS domain-containing protein [Cyclobacteriaceae bacterium]